MGQIDMILHEKHGNRLSVIALDHLEPGLVSLTVVPHGSDYLSIYGATFDCTIEDQVALIKTMLMNLNRYAPARLEEIHDFLNPSPEAA